MSNSVTQKLIATVVESAKLVGLGGIGTLIVGSAARRVIYPFLPEGLKAFGVITLESTFIVGCLPITTAFAVYHIAQKTLSLMKLEGRNQTLANRIIIVISFCAAAGIAVLSSHLLAIPLALAIFDSTTGAILTLAVPYVLSKTLFKSKLEKKPTGQAPQTDDVPPPLPPRDDPPPLPPRDEPRNDNRRALPPPKPRPGYGPIAFPPLKPPLKPIKLFSPLPPKLNEEPKDDNTPPPPPLQNLPSSLPPKEELTNDNRPPLPPPKPKPSIRHPRPASPSKPITPSISKINSDNDRLLELLGKFQEKSKGFSKFDVSSISRVVQKQRELLEERLIKLEGKPANNLPAIEVTSPCFLMESSYDRNITETVAFASVKIPALSNMIKFSLEICTKYSERNFERAFAILRAQSNFLQESSKRIDVCFEKTSLDNFSSQKQKINEISNLLNKVKTTSIELEQKIMSDFEGLLKPNNVILNSFIKDIRSLIHNKNSQYIMIQEIGKLQFELYKACDQKLKFLESKLNMMNEEPKNDITPLPPPPPKKSEKTPPTQEELEVNNHLINEISNRRRRSFYDDDSDDSDSVSDIEI